MTGTNNLYTIKCHFAFNSSSKNCWYINGRHVETPFKIKIVFHTDKLTS